jgi:predicted nucleic acid-binding protein
MTTTDADRLFVDTNVLLHAVYEASPHCERCRAAIDDQLRRGAVCCISGQVVRELMVNLTHPRTFSRPKTPAEVCTLAAELREQFVMLSDAGNVVLDQLLELVGLHAVVGKQVHDCNIVATMLASGVTRLLTRNAADFRRYEPRIAVIEVSSGT